MTICFPAKIIFDKTVPYNIQLTNISVKMFRRQMPLLSFFFSKNGAFAKLFFKYLIFFPKNLWNSYSFNPNICASYKNASNEIAIKCKIFCLNLLLRFMPVIELKFKEGKAVTCKKKSAVDDDSESWCWGWNDKSWSYDI